MSLEQSIQLHREQIAQAIDAASDWRSKSDWGSELFCLYNALRDSLCVAVSHYETPQSGIEYLKTECKPMVFDRAVELIRALHINHSVSSGTYRAPGLFQLVLTVHTAWLLNLYAEAEELTSACDDERQIRFY